MTGSCFVALVDSLLHRFKPFLCLRPLLRNAAYELFAADVWCDSAADSTLQELSIGISVQACAEQCRDHSRCGFFLHGWDTYWNDNKCAVFSSCASTVPYETGDPDVFRMTQIGALMPAHSHGAGPHLTIDESMWSRRVCAPNPRRFIRLYRCRRDVIVGLTALRGAGVQLHGPWLYHCFRCGRSGSRGL